MKLAYKILVIIIPVALFAMAVLTLVTFVTSRGQIQKADASNQLDLSAQTMDKIDRQFNERLNDIQQLSLEEQLLTFVKDKKANSAPIVDKLNQLSIITGPWDILSLVDQDGKVVSSTRPNLINKPLPKDSEASLAFDQAIKGENYYSDYHLSDDTGKPTVIFAAPFKDPKDPSAKPFGLVIGYLSWQIIPEILNDVPANAILFGKTGEVIAQNNKYFDQNLIGKNYSDKPLVKAIADKKSHSQLVDVTQSLINQASQASVAPQNGYLNYQGSGWGLVLETPTKIILAPLTQTVTKLALIFLAIVVVSAGSVTVLIIKAIVKPINLLTKTAQQIAGGDLSQQANVKSSDEIGRLATSFNQMTQGLKQKIAQISEEKIKLHASIDSLSLGFIMTDKENNIAIINQAASNILCVADPKNPDAKHTCSLADIEQSLKGVIDLRSLITTCISEKKSVFLKDTAFNSSFLKLYITPIIENSEAIGTVVLIEDITEAKIIDRSKDEFFSIASHELRTPLTSIKGNSTMIMDYFADALKANKDLKDMMVDIHDSSVRLIDIVNDFLDLSRLEQGKVVFKPEEFALEEVIESVVYEMKPIIQEKKLYLKFDKITLNSLPKIWADKNRTKQIIYNLIGNAVKFTDQGGVTVTANTQEDLIKVFVSDSGPGMSLDAQKLLFHKFQQASNSLLTRNTARGTGLGLYISKMMTENMGGSMGLDNSQEGKGSTFSFTLPIATPKRKQMNTSASQTDTATGLTKNQPTS